MASAWEQRAVRVLSARVMALWVWSDKSSTCFRMISALSTAFPATFADWALISCNLSCKATPTCSARERDSSVVRLKSSARFLNAPALSERSFRSPVGGVGQFSGPPVQRLGKTFRARGRPVRVDGQVGCPPR